MNNSHSHRPSLVAVKLSIPMLTTEAIQAELDKLDKIITALQEDNSVQVDYYLQKQDLFNKALKTRVINSTVNPKAS